MEDKERLDPVDPEVQMIKFLKSKDSHPLRCFYLLPFKTPPSTHNLNLNLNLNFPPYDMLCSVLPCPSLLFPSLPC